MKKNNTARTREPASANLQTQNDVIPLFGRHPAGSLILAEDMRFNVILNDLDVPPFSTEAGKRMSNSVQPSKVPRHCMYDTYTVDTQGNFATQHVGSTFPD